MHNMLKKGSWFIPLASSTLRCAYAVFLASLSSLAYQASLGLFRCSAFVGTLAICIASLVCLAAGCSAALRTRHLSSLACLTSVCSDLLRFGLFGADAAV